jgi:heme-degrading monooxygenase HmoA
MRLQDAWHATHFPNLPSDAGSRAAVWFEQVDDPSQVMTTARWESVAAHWDWIRSEENIGVMEGLDKHIVAKETVLFHVDADIFGASAVSAESNVTLRDSPVISVSRVSVLREQKGAFAAKFDEVKGVLEEFTGQGLVKFGWREDGEAEAKTEEFVIVCGWESVERHLECAQSPGYFKYAEIRPLVAKADVKHYKRLL